MTMSRSEAGRKGAQALHRNANNKKSGTSASKRAAGAKSGSQSHSSNQSTQRGK